MKKTLTNILLLAAAITLGVSCQKETNANSADLQLEDCSVSADVLGADTKVALDGTTPKWEANDQILVLDANNKPLGGTGLFTITSGSGTNTGNFSGKKYIGQTPAYAIYPASVYDAATGKFTLPTAQDGTVTTAFKSYAVMMGTVSNGNITFANVCAVLKINTGDYGKSGGEAAIKSLKVSAATSAIAGEFTPDWTNNTIAPVADGASQEVTATAANAETGYAANTDIYIPVFPVENQSISIKFANTEGKVATVSETFAPAVNKIKDLGIAGGMEFIVDPEYWVDYDMVSTNGHKLYISKYYVKEIDSDGNVTFYTEGQYVEQEFNIDDIKDKDLKFAGLSCKLLSSSEGFALLESSNFTHSAADNNCSFTRVNTGEVLTLRLPFLLSDCIIHGDYSKPIIYRQYDKYPITHNSTGKTGFVRLCIEDNNLCHKIDDSFDFILVSNGTNYVGGEELNPTNVDLPVYTTRILIISQIFDEINDYHCFFTGSSFPTGVSVDKNGEGVPTCPLISFGSNDTGTVTITYCGTRSFEYSSSCFLVGTLITLADGSKKPVEEITYDDELKVWNFDKGCYDTANILWLTKSELHNDHYIKCTFSDGTVLNVTGDKSHHKLYNYDEHYFQGVTKMEPGTRVFTENGVVTLVSKEWIDEDVEYYNLITDRHINCFAEGVLTSARYNNTYPIDDEMKFVKDDREKRPYKEFKAAGISREWYVGLRLGEQTDSIDEIRKYIDKCESQMADKSAPSLWQRIRTWWKSIFG